MERDREHHLHIAEDGIFSEHLPNSLAQTLAHLRLSLQEEEVLSQSASIWTDVPQEIQYHLRAGRALRRSFARAHGHVTAPASRVPRTMLEIGPARGADDPIGERVHGLSAQSTSGGKDHAEQAVNEAVPEQGDPCLTHGLQPASSSENGF
jgi:hypothetical protein